MVEVGQCRLIVSEERKHYGSCGAFEWKQSAVSARGGSDTASYREGELIAPTQGPVGEKLTMQESSRDGGGQHS